MPRLFAVVTVLMVTVVSALSGEQGTSQTSPTPRTPPSARPAVVTPARSAAASPAPAAAASSVMETNATLRALLTEVQGLRDDLVRLNAQSVQAQLLVGRLQMQEQRIAHLNDLLQQSSVRLSQANREVNDIEDGIQRLTKSGCRFFDPAQVKECEDELDRLKVALMRMQENANRLRIEEDDLRDNLRLERARWNEFNRRLDELEQ